jgi:hypothetical protein
MHHVIPPRGYPHPNAHGGREHLDRVVSMGGINVGLTVAARTTTKLMAGCMTIAHRILTTKDHSGPTTTITNHQITMITAGVDHGDGTAHGDGLPVAFGDVRRSH